LRAQPGIDGAVVLHRRWKAQYFVHGGLRPM
jgi:hypothetical protein